MAAEIQTYCNSRQTRRELPYRAESLEGGKGGREGWMEGWRDGGITAPSVAVVRN